MVFMINFSEIYRTEIVVSKSGLQYTVQTYFEKRQTSNGLIYKIPHTMAIGGGYEQEFESQFIPQTTIPQYDLIVKGHFYLVDPKNLELLEFCRCNESGFSFGAHHIAEAIHSSVVSNIKNDEGGERVKVIAS